MRQACLKRGVMNKRVSAPVHLIKCMEPLRA